MIDYLFYKFCARGDSEDYVIDKQKSVLAYKGYMINRLQKMFHYENLPETIPQYMLEYYLLVNGSCVIAKYNKKLYAFIGSFGGESDPYYRPTKYVVANPALKMNEKYDLWDVDGNLSKDIVFMRNDIMWMGLNPLMSRYATLLAENVITLRTADIMLRVVALLTAPDDKTRIAAEAYLKKVEKGELGVIGENRFFEGVKMQSPPSNNGSYLTQFIELQQYYKGSFFNEIGLSASFNMKREAIGEGEATLNEDTLAPLIDTMLQCRQEDISRLNELFDLNVKVEFDSSWKQNLEETKLKLEVIKEEIEDENSSEETEDENSSEETEDENSSEETEDENSFDQEGDDVSQLTQVNIVIQNGTDIEKESEIISDESEENDESGEEKESNED